MMKFPRLGAALILVSICFSANAGVLKIENARSPEAPPVAPVMGGYLTLSNAGDQDVEITAVESPSFKKVEIHNMLTKDGMMHMQKQDSLVIPAKGKVELKPGGYHLMLMQPKQPHRAGDKIIVTLTFKSGKSQKVTLAVIKPDADDNNGHHHHMHH